MRLRYVGIDEPESGTRMTGGYRVLWRMDGEGEVWGWTVNKALREMP